MDRLVIELEEMEEEELSDDLDQLLDDLELDLDGLEDTEDLDDMLDDSEDDELDLSLDDDDEDLDEMFDSIIESDMDIKLDEREEEIEGMFDEDLDDLDDFDIDDDDLEAELEALEAELDLEFDDDDLEEDDIDEILELEIKEVPLKESELTAELEMLESDDLEDIVEEPVEEVKPVEEVEPVEVEPVREIEPVEVEPVREVEEADERELMILEGADLYEDDKKAEFQEVIQDAKKELADLRDKPISEKMVKQLLKEAIQLKDTGDYDGAIKLGIQAIEASDKLNRFIKKTQSVKEMLIKLKRNKVPYADLLEELRAAKEKVEQGMFKKGDASLDGVTKNIKTRIKEHAFKEKKHDIDAVVNELTKLLGIAKEMKVTLKDERQMISEALVASRLGDVKDAHEKLVNVRDSSLNKMEKHVTDNIDELELQLIEHAMDDKKRYEVLLTKSRDALNAGSFLAAWKHVMAVKKDVKDKTQPEKELRFDKMEELVKYAKAIGIDCKESEDLLSEAKTEYELGDIRESEMKLQRSKDILMRSIPTRVQAAMKGGLKKLDKARKEDKNISKPVSHLKQANLMLKRRDYLNALKHIGAFSVLVNELLDEEEEIEEQPEEKPMDVITNTRQKVPAENASYTIKRVDRTANRAPRREKKEEPKLPDKLQKACTYLILEKKSNKAFMIFKGMLDEGMKGICVTRQYPAKVKSKFDLNTVPVIWLSNIDQKNAYKPKNLEKLSLEMEIFLSKKHGIILLDGLEYLISNNDFRTVFHLIQSIKDQVAVTDSILVLSASPLTLEDNQIELLEKEVDDTFKL